MNTTKINKTNKIIIITRIKVKNNNNIHIINTMDNINILTILMIKTKININNQHHNLEYPQLIKKMHNNIIMKATMFHPRNLLTINYIFIYII